MDQLLSPRQTAELLGVSAATLANWRYSKLRDLPYVKVGRQVKYRMCDIEAWLDRQTVRALDPDSVPQIKRMVRSAAAPR